METFPAWTQLYLVGKADFFSFPLVFAETPASLSEHKKGNTSRGWKLSVWKRACGNEQPKRAVVYPTASKLTLC